ncbi:hypothetical protein RUM43_012651 [Polyplax serrata]|uniref:Uncharacterized protein n=1 Tax=Polyplax serrata TaxID=468196 RepID=A0AAN8S9P5_POLSC
MRGRRTYEEEKKNFLKKQTGRRKKFDTNRWKRRKAQTYRQKQRDHPLIGGCKVFPAESKPSVENDLALQFENTKPGLHQGDRTDKLPPFNGWINTKWEKNRGTTRLRKSRQVSFEEQQSETRRQKLRENESLKDYELRKDYKKLVIEIFGKQSKKMTERNVEMLLKSRDQRWRSRAWGGPGAKVEKTQQKWVKEDWGGKQWKWREN